MSTERREWDRREGEGLKPYTAFTLFLNLDKPRKLAKVYPDAPQRLPLMKRWSARHEWFKRAEAYDADMARAEHEARRAARAEAAGDSELEAYRERLKQNANLIGALGRALTGAAAKALKALGDDAAPPSSISSAARAAAQLLATEADLSAASLGVDDLIGAFTRGQQEDE